MTQVETGQVRAVLNNPRVLAIDEDIRDMGWELVLPCIETYELETCSEDQCARAVLSNFYWPSITIKC